MSYPCFAQRSARKTAALLWLAAASALALSDPFSATARAATKANNNNPIDQASSWVDGLLPDNNNLAIWDNTVTGPLTPTIGAPLLWLGIIVQNPGGSTTVASGNSLSLGAAGIDMSAATADLTFNNFMILAANQTWNVQSARTLAVNSGFFLAQFSVTLTGAGNFDLNSITGTGGFTMNGTGTLALTGDNSSTYSGTTNLFSGTILCNDDQTLSPNSVYQLNGGIIDFNGHDQKVKAFSGRSGSITNSSPFGATLEIANGNPALASNVMIGGNINVVVNGSQRLTNLASTYSSGTAIITGTLGVVALKNGNQPSSIGSSSNDPANLLIETTLEYDGEQAAFTDRLFTVGSALTTNITWTVAPINFTNTGPLVFEDDTGTFTLSAPTSTKPALMSTFSPQVSGDTSSVIIAGMWKLTNTANSYTGPTVINASAVLVTDKLSDGLIASPIGASSNNVFGLQFFNGTLRYTGTGDSTDRAFSGSSATIDSSGTGPLAFTNSGPLALTAGLTLRGSNTGNNVFTPMIQGSTFTKLDLGTWVLINANSYTGNTTVDAGLLTLDFSARGVSSIINAASRLVIGGGELRIVGSPGSANTQSFSSTVVGGGVASARINGSQNGATSLTVALGAITHSAGGTVDFVPPTTGGITTTSLNGATSILGGWATAAGGTTWATVSAGQIIPLAAYANDAWTGTSDTTVTTFSTFSAVTTNSLRFNANAPAIVSLSGVNTISSGGILITPAVGANAPALTGGSLKTAAGQDFNIIQNNTRGVFALASSILDNGGTSLTKAGDGTLILSASNSYTGTTFILGGTVQLGAVNALPGGNVSLNGVLDLHGFNASIASLFSAGIAQHGVVTDSVAAPATLTLSPIGSVSYSGDMTGPITLQKTGTGTFALFTRQHYTGDTSIAGGVLQLQITSVSGFDAGSNNIPTTSNVLFDGGQLLLTAGYRQDLNNATVHSGDSSISATAAFPTGGRLHIANLARNAGTTLLFLVNSAPDGVAGVLVDQVNAAPIANGPSGILGGWAVVGPTSSATDWASVHTDLNNAIAGGATYVSTFDAPTHNTDITSAAPVTALSNATTGSIRFSTAGATLFLNGSNVIASGGILVSSAVNDQTIISGGSTSTLTSATGELIVNAYDTANSSGLKINAIIADNGAQSMTLIKSGPGTLTLNSANTYSGATLINQGMLRISNNNSLHNITGNGSLMLLPGVTLASNRLNVNAYTLGGSHTIRATASANSFASVVHTLTIAGATNAWTGKLDIGNNPLILLTANSSSKATTLTTTYNQVLSGSAANWTGNGITSSTITSNTNTTLAVVDNVELGKTTFDGQAIDANSVIVTQALQGDADLNGIVDFNDLVTVAHHFNQTGLGWAMGNFDVASGSNTVDFNDLVSVAHHFNQTFSVEPQLDGAGISTAVPEPAAIFSLLGLAPALLLRRKTRS